MAEQIATTASMAAAEDVPLMILGHMTLPPVDCVRSVSGRLIEVGEKYHGGAGNTVLLLGVADAGLLSASDFIFA